MDPVITPLSQPLNSFPHFMPNQVLTHTQLNELAVYLEQQDRFTRQRLIGIGIVCGLQAKLITAGTRTVKISRGVGVTSCGFLIDVPSELSFTKKKIYTTPANYDPFLVGAANTPITCIELKDDASTESGISILTANDVDDKIVVLFLDLEDKPNGKCIGENCDEKGNKWLFTLRVLLMNRANTIANPSPLQNINRVLRESYTPNPFNNPLTSNAAREDFFNPEYELPTVFAERFGNVNGINPGMDFNLSTIGNFADFENTYRTIIRDSAIRIANALYKTYELFKPVFDTQLLINASPFAGYDLQTPANSLAKQLLDLLNPADPSYRKGNCQYIYDFVRDLIDTYHELRAEFFALSSECSPDPSKFPRHLLLGELETGVDFGKFNPADYAPPSVYRNHFIYSPILDGQSAHLKKAKMLIRRIQLMINSLNFSGLLQGSINEEPIIITPDKTCSEPLGNQRIPFYYNKEGVIQLSRFWDFSYTIQNRSFENRSYWAELYVPTALPAALKAKLIYPLLYDICSLPKLSIEGHVGKELETAIEELKKFRKRFNLSFDILALKLDNNFNQVFLADENLFADLQTLYLAERNEVVCCLEDLRDYITKNQGMIVFFLSLILLVVSDNPQAIIAILSLVQNILTQLLDAYVKVIDDMIIALAPDIKAFDFPKMMNAFPAFTSFTSIFKYGINTWGDIEVFLLNDKDGSGLGSKGFNWALSDLISIILNMWELYLDKVTDDCMLGKFYTIYSSFYERVQTFSLFGKFNAKIHGMEHIAGTSKGGTFILVYEDEEEKKQVSGQVLNEAGKAVKGAFIQDEHTGIIYGKTDDSGLYNVIVPKATTSLKYVKAGFVSGMAEVRGKKAAKSKMFSYNAAASSKKVSGMKMSDSDKAFVKMKASLESIKAMDESFAKLGDYIKFDTADFVLGKISFVPSGSYRVVADFYLPHLIHNYKTEEEPIDACSELGEVKMIDFSAISAAMSKDVTSTSGKTSFKGFNIFRNAKDQ